MGRGRAHGYFGERAAEGRGWLRGAVFRSTSGEVAALSDLAVVLNHVGSPILGGPYRGQKDDFADCGR